MSAPPTLRCREILRRESFSRLAQMPRLSLWTAAAGLTVAAMLGLTACGGEDAKLLPGETAREITANLDTVQQLSDEGDCIGAESAAEQVGEQIEALEGVDRKLKVALEGGAVRLEEVIAECEEVDVEAIAPATVPTEAEEEEKSKGKEDKEEEEKEKPKDEEAESPSLPPQAKGKAKGPEKGQGPPPSEEAPEEPPAESPSGGVSPGEPAGEGE
jgi:hypothetical protein